MSTFIYNTGDCSHLLLLNLGLFLFSYSVIQELSEWGVELRTLKDLHMQCYFNGKFMSSVSHKDLFPVVSINSMYECKIAHKDLCFLISFILHLGSLFQCMDYVDHWKVR